MSVCVCGALTLGALTSGVLLAESALVCAEQAHPASCTNSEVGVLWVQSSGGDIIS